MRTSYAIGVNNGTTALHLAMLALGIGPGDEVIIPANTFIATAWGISYTAPFRFLWIVIPIPGKLIASKMEEKITSKTKAVIGVHLYGQPFDIDAVQAVCNKNRLWIVEDAAQAQGAGYMANPSAALAKWLVLAFIPVKISVHVVRPVELPRNNHTIINICKPPQPRLYKQVLS